MITVKGFSYWYPGEEEPALEKIDLTIPQGQFCGVVGANGAGKSTLCSALSGFVPHFFHGEFEGEVRIDKHMVAQTPLGELAGEVGLVFQNPFNQIGGARFTVREEIAFGLENLGLSKKEMETRIAEVLDLVGIEELADRSPFALSGGQQQRVALASILAMQPKVLVLDEPTAQLDPRSTEDVFSALRGLVQRAETTVVMVEHKLEWLADFVDRVIALDRGRIELDDSPTKVLSSPRMVKMGIGRTQYTETAAAAKRGKLKLRPKILPVTLDQARTFFR